MLLTLKKPNKHKNVTNRELRLTGIATRSELRERRSFVEELARICDNFVVAEGVNIFGKVLALALTQREFMSAFTERGVEELKASMEAANKGGRDIIRLDSAGSDEADSAIDNYLFGDPEADTAF